MSHEFSIQQRKSMMTHGPSHHNPVTAMLGIVVPSFAAYVFMPIVQQFMFFAALTPEQLTAWTTAVCMAVYTIVFTGWKTGQIMMIIWRWWKGRPAKLIVPGSDDEIESFKPRKNGLAK